MWQALAAHLWATVVFRRLFPVKWDGYSYGSLRNENTEAAVQPSESLPPCSLLLFLRAQLGSPSKSHKTYIMHSYPLAAHLHPHPHPKNGERETPERTIPAIAASSHFKQTRGENPFANRRCVPWIWRLKWSHPGSRPHRSHPDAIRVSGQSSAPANTTAETPKTQTRETPSSC